MKTYNLCVLINKTWMKSFKKKRGLKRRPKRNWRQR